MGLVLSSTPRQIAEKRETSLHMQITEAERDLELRRNPPKRPPGKMAKSVVELLIERQAAIFETITWARDNERRLKEWWLTKRPDALLGDRISIGRQFTEAKYELGQRKSWDLNGAKRPRESDNETNRRIATLEAIIRTLKWLKAGRAEFEDWCTANPEPVGQDGAA